MCVYINHYSKVHVVVNVIFKYIHMYVCAFNFLCVSMSCVFCVYMHIFCTYVVMLLQLQPSCIIYINNYFSIEEILSFKN